MSSSDKSADVQSCNGTKTQGASAPAARSILAPSRLAFGVGRSSAAEGSNLTAKMAFPGLKASKLSSVVESVCTTAPNPEVRASAATAEKPSFMPLQKEKEESSPDKSGSDKNPKEEAPALAVSSAPAPPSSVSEDKSKDPSQFVFGQNLSDRAANFTASQTASAAAADPSSVEKSNGSNGGSEKAPAAAGDSPQVPKEPEAAKTLTESAAKYCENLAKKPKYEEVKLQTGEEGEANVIQMNAKLYLFEKANSSWLERGRGQLRLNDVVEGGTRTSSRLVMRTFGSLRVILNTKLFATMNIERPTEKNIRLTGMDDQDQNIKVFLVSGTSNDIGSMYSALKSRVRSLVPQQEEGKKEQQPQPTAETKTEDRKSPGQQGQGVKRKPEVDEEKEGDVDTPPSKKAPPIPTEKSEADKD